ncbi:respiratory nitrate reductase subunit gamma, partial [Staphylococcus pseudintermedius]|uniref:respiratory nitrate reductase subunit gamma n=1 Tax=Staphylococcus pseudintermedius TaxID=283734 RepID=UPI000E3A30A9
FTLSPDANLMTEVPLAFQLHVLLGFTIMACWPFTRLVHVWSAPVSYASRSYLVYRKHYI